MEELELKISKMHKELDALTERLVTMNARILVVNKRLEKVENKWDPFMRTGKK